MSEEVIVSDDWTKNWQASIAVKITALVLWVIIVVVFIAAASFLKDLESRLHDEYEFKADRLAYQISGLLSDHPEILDQSGFTEQVAELQKNSDFAAITLNTGKNQFFVGQDVDDLVVIDRHLPIAVNGRDAVDLQVYHKHLDRLVEERRNQLVIAIFTLLLVFGLFLTWSIRTIVHRPLQQLVNATRAVSEGQRDVRLDVSREDEFGYLSRFFNQMLDRLMGQQSELEMAAEEARSASRAKSAFLANMSHELRTPLNAIIGYSEMLQEEVEELQVQDLKPDLDKINAAGRHLLTLINDVLDLSKIEAGKIEVEPTIFQVDGLMQDVIDTIQPMINRNGNQLEMEVGDRTRRLLTDETKLRQVLVNLLSNAAKFTENGRVSVKVRQISRDGNDWMEFIVRDTGIGIAPEMVDKLFKDFSQIDSTSTRKYSGSGLGLAISRRFCEKLGGTITVDSRPGEGSVFTAAIPVDYNLVRSETAETETVKVPRKASTPLHKVLVVDHDPLIREQISRFLSAEGYHVFIAETQKRALEMAEREMPDVITLDAALCRQQGCNLYEYLRNDRQLKEVPVILLSEEADLTQDKLAGAAGYLEKPVERRDLLRLIRNACESTTGKTALIVDDNASSRELLTRALRSQGISVVEAGDGREALSLVESHFPAVVFTDLILPNMNGFDLIKSIRGRPKAGNVPIVVVTAMDLNEVDRGELESEHALILEKGVNLKQRVIESLEYYALL